MNTVLFVNATIGFSESLSLVNIKNLFNIVVISQIKSYFKKTFWIYYVSPSTGGRHIVFGSVIVVVGVVVCVISCEHNNF